MSHKLSWDAARPMTKGLRATLIAVATFAMSAITPTHADTLTGCPPDNFGAPCSDAFFFPTALRQFLASSELARINLQARLGANRQPFF